MDRENGGEQPEDEANHDVPPAEASICAASEGEKSAASHHKPGNGAQPPENVRKITWLEYVLAGTNIALVLVGIWALTVYRDQLNVMQGTLDQMKNTATQTDRLITESAKQSKASGDSAKAAQNQVNLMQRQLEATDRPWIQVTDASVVTPLTFEGSRISVGIRLTVKSVGSSAAMEIGPKWQLIVSKGAGTVIGPIIKKQEEVCSQKRVGAFAPLTLFPGQSSKDVWADALSLNSWVNDITDQIAELPIPSKPKVIFPILVGCIDYQSSSGTHHQSRFVYSLHTNGYFIVGRDVPVGQLRWDRYAFGGFDVN